MMLAANIQTAEDVSAARLSDKNVTFTLVHSVTDVTPEAGGSISLPHALLDATLLCK